MTRMVMKILALISACAFGTSLGLFYASWNEHNFPDWGLDLRWLLFLTGATVAIIVAIDQHIVSTKEAFAIGVKVGERPGLRISADDFDDCKSDTGPQPLPERR